MKGELWKVVGVMFILLTASRASGQDMTRRSNESAATVVGREVPVTAGDILDRPYRVLGRVDTVVRRLTILSRAPSEAKVYRELWERAVRMGANAVIHAQYGAPETSLDASGARRADGIAIKFLGAEEIELLPQQSE